MNSIKKYYWVIFLTGTLLAGVLVFSTSYHSFKKSLIEQTYHTIEAVTDVKRDLLDRKLFSLEQQLNLFSKNKLVSTLLVSNEENKSSQKTVQEFDEYAESLLNNQGCSNLLLIRSSGEVIYTNNPSQSSHIHRIAQQSIEKQKSTPLPKLIVNETEPHQFYLTRPITDTKGIVVGTLFLEVPKEFLSIELHNTINLDSLSSYLVSSQGIMDHQGKINPETCISCRWSEDEFIQFSPAEKISETWTLLSVYPISEIRIRHSLYLSALNGMLAFFVSGIFVMIIMYSIQLVQKSKGITNADILLVQTTWNAVSEYSTNIIGGFYRHLFADAPEVKPMFKSERSEQEKRMASMINTIVNSADSLEEFKVSIAQLAKRHVHMGVKKEYFPIVVKAIVSSVEEQYGKGFGPAHKKAWYKILNKISAIMIEEMESYRAARVASPSTENE
jgi:hemoglobin-like flavoprotein